MNVAAHRMGLCQCGWRLTLLLLLSIVGNSLASMLVGNAATPASLVSILQEAILFNHSKLTLNHERSLLGLPPCESLITEESDFPDIVATPLLPALASGKLLVVNGNFFGDGVDTVKVTLTSSISTLSLKLYVKNSLTYGFHGLIVLENELEQFDFLVEGYCGADTGDRVCTGQADNLASGSYVIRVASESSEPYQLHICVDDCTWPDEPNFSNLQQCAGDGSEATHKYKILPGSFTATMSGSTTLQIQGRYPVSLPLTEASGRGFLYQQSIHLVDSNGKCSNAYSNVALQSLAGTGSILEAAFSLNVASMPSSIYVKSSTSLGMLRICYRVQLFRKGFLTSLLMNQVDTVLAVSISISPSFNTVQSASILTNPSVIGSATALFDAGSITSLQVSLLHLTTGGPLLSPIRSGQAIKVRVENLNGLRLTNILESSLTTNAGKTIRIVQNGSPQSTQAVVGPIDCEIGSLACEFSLALPFSGFFDQSYVVQLSGTALVGFGAARDRRLAAGNETQVFFSMSFVTLPDEVDSTAVSMLNCGYLWIGLIVVVGFVGTL